MNAPLNPTDIARETFRQLATQRIAPTPDNYRDLYHRIGGHGSSEEEEDLAGKLTQFAEQLPKTGPPGDVRKTLEKVLARRDWKNLSAILLALAQTDGGKTRPEQTAERQGSREWTKTLRALMQSFETNHAGWTRAKKRDALDTLLNSVPRDPDALLTRLRALVSGWEETPAARTLIETAEGVPDPAQDTPGNVAQHLRDCLITALDVALPALLRHAPDLAWEARTLAGRVRLADDAAALIQLGNDLRLFTQRAELHGGGDGQIREALLRLLRLIVDNMRELVEGDHWIQGQVAIVKNVLDRPLTPEVIEEAERAIKDLMIRQGALKRSLEEARASLKALLQDFIDRLGGMSDDTSDYQAKLETYSSRLQQTDAFVALNDIIRDLLRDTRSMHEATEQTGKALTTARQHVQAAEARIQQMERELEHLTERAREDQLTGTLNRRGLDEAFKREAARADRQSSPMCVALLDIDNFKKLNDTLGHQAGDEALMHIVQVIKEHLRPADALARYGGEEFVILLPDSDVSEAMDVMARLQRELTKRFFLHNNEKLLITFSCGVSQRSSSEDLEPAVSRADRALYQAKRSGKNRVCAAEN
ncbi:MAG: diguanylate cyclase [Betaproteobacteria bacterium]|nr:diguanylate cyclase [Betaproteobacteria bacterium]